MLIKILPTLNKRKQWLKKKILNDYKEAIIKQITNGIKAVENNGGKPTKQSTHKVKELIVPPGLYSTSIWNSLKRVEKLKCKIPICAYTAIYICTYICISILVWIIF